jgi:NifU-like protein involved in Fe-S cluster formation
VIIGEEVEGQLFSDTVREHVQMPRNVGPLEGATHVGKVGEEGGGPYMTLWLQVVEGRIERAAYATFGCPSAIASGSMVAQIVTGRTIEQALRLDPEDVVLLLGGLPEGKGHLAEMAVNALRDALEIS